LPVWRYARNHQAGNGRVAMAADCLFLHDCPGVYCRTPDFPRNNRTWMGYCLTWMYRPAYRSHLSPWPQPIWLEGHFAPGPARAAAVVATALPLHPMSPANAADNSPDRRRPRSGSEGSNWPLTLPASRDTMTL